MITLMILESDNPYNLETALSILVYKDVMRTHKIVGFVIRKRFLRSPIYTVIIEGMGMESVWKSVLEYIDNKKGIHAYYSNFVE